MSIQIQRVVPFAARKVAISTGGVDQITIIEFPDAIAGEVITLVVESDSVILQEGAGDEGDAYNDDLAFPVPTGGYARFNVAGWGDALPRILLASATPGAIVRIMLADKA